MAAIIWTDVTNFASQMATVPADAQAVILAHVNTWLAVDKWGGEESPKLKLARIYVAAHFGMGAMPTSSGGATGPVIMESEDDVSRQYATFTMPGLDVDPLWDSTFYGRAYRLLVRTNPLLRGPRVA